MSTAGKTEPRGPGSDAGKGATFHYFRRLLGYVWPHKRYLFPALGCILVMGVAYSASIGAIGPILTVMVQEEGLHGWTDQYIAEKRLVCRLIASRDSTIDGIPSLAARIFSLKPDSVLRKAGLESGDYLLGVNDSPPPGLSYEVIQRLAEPETEATITYLRPGAASPQPTTVILPELTTTQAALGRAMNLIPRGYTPDDRWRSLTLVLAGLAVVVLVGNLARVFAQYLIVLINTRAIIDLRREMYAHVLRLPLSRFSQNTSDTMSMFTQDMNDIFRGLNNFFQKLVAEPIKASGAVIIAVALDWKLTVVVLLGAPFIAILFRKLGKKIRRANRKLLIGYGQMLGRLESTLSGMRVVKAYTRESYERRKLFQIDRGVLRQQLKMAFIEALTSPFLEVLGFLAAVGAILYFGHQVLYEGVKAPNFIAMLACLAAIFDPIRKLSSVYPKLQRANAAAARIFALIDSPSEYDEDMGKASLGTFQRSIEFDHVMFTYPGSDRPAVRDVSLAINKGEIIAIVGPNGSGKTTLLSLLPRMFPLSEGRIRIDGQDVTEVTLRSLRRQFSLITQESVIFPDTVRANIAYGRPDASFAEIEAAARKAFADEFIQQIPDGYDAVVGEHGATLSGGQRQRLAIARAILRDAPILIFDEATSQVDPESELKIHQALDTILEDSTAFIIAHRYSTISGADRIAVMDEGSVVAVGPHDELVASCPLYRRLYETQFRNST